MRDLTLDEIEAVSGGSTDYEDIGVSVGLTGLALGAVAVGFPVAAGIAAVGAIVIDGVAIYNELQ